MRSYPARTCQLIIVNVCGHNLQWTAYCNKPQSQKMAVQKTRSVMPTTILSIQPIWEYRQQGWQKSHYWPSKLASCVKLGTKFSSAIWFLRWCVCKRNNLMNSNSTAIEGQRSVLNANKELKSKLWFRTTTERCPLKKGRKKNWTETWAVLACQRCCSDWGG